MTIDAYGDGARSTFKVLAPLIALSELVKMSNTSGIFIWEEPELFQHPQTLERLLHQIVDVIKETQIQTFIATHSLEVVAHFTAMVQKKILPDDKLMAYRCDLQEGTLRSSWFTTSNITAWLETGWDPRVWGDFRPSVRFIFQEE